MRTVASVLLALVAASNANAQQSRADAVAYVVALTIPDTGSVIDGVTSILLKNPGDTVRLNLVGMQVDSVLRRDGDDHGTPIPFHYNGQIISVATGRGSTAALMIKYHGAPQDGLIIGPNAHGQRVAFADNWPERARFWFPAIDRPSDKAQVMFVVKAPESWRVVANGTSAGRQWKASHPIPTYTMVIGGGAFTVSKHRPVINGRDTIPIEVWTYPEDSAFADSVPFRRATEIVEVMQRLIGPYPYENLKHVQSSTRFGGMENASAIFYAEKPYVERKMGEGVVRHETAHQWFGDAVTERDWPDLWLSEGFATYFDAVIGAALDGDSVLTREMHDNAESYFKSDVIDRPIVDSANAGDPIKLLNANSYPKGAWVLHMLRELMGDSAFFHGLRTYYQTYRDSNATSQDFERVMEKAAKADYGWFFHQWLHQPGYPQLDVTWHYDAGAGRVFLGITQRQKPEWGLFHLPRVALEFRSATGAHVRRDVTITGRTTNVRLDMSFPPTEVVIDPDGQLLARTTVSTGGH